MPKMNVSAFVVWDESMPLVQLVDFLTINHFAAVIGPLHDKDFYTEQDVARWRKSQEDYYGDFIPEGATEYAHKTGEMIAGNYGQMIEKTIIKHVPQVGEQKKPHRHVYLQLDYSAPLTTWINLLAPLDIHYVEVVKSKRGYLRYLCHLDNPEKARYDTADVIALGGVDISCIFEKSQRDADTLEDLILDTIADKGVKSITALQNVLLHEVRNREAYREVKAHYGYWHAYMRNIYIEAPVKVAQLTPKRVPADADGVIREDVTDDAA